jgi:outer membrane protein TolC
MRSLLTVAALTGLFCLPAMVSAQIISVDQAVAEARRVNPQIHTARFRWESAKHQIIQNYTPAEPQFTFTNSDSWRVSIYESGLHNVTLTQALQYPGKGLLQGQNEVMLVGYQSGKTDSTTLISAFRQWHDARSTYLQAVNALLAGKVALEQAAGGSLQ